MKQWIPECGSYLDDLLSLEGRGEFISPRCPSCSIDDFDAFTAEFLVPGPEPCIRCKDCFTGELVCESCCVRLHRQHPLHVIEVRWLVQYFISLVLTTVAEMEWIPLRTHLPRRYRSARPTGSSIWCPLLQSEASPNGLHGHSHQRASSRRTRLL